MTSYQSVDEVLEAVWSVVEFANFKQKPLVNSIGIFGNVPLKIVIINQWGQTRLIFRFSLSLS